MSDNGDFTAGMLLASLGWLIILAIAIAATIDVQHRNAVKAGAAEYTVNPQTGETKFVWKTQK
jgi:hypothetical protein